MENINGLSKAIFVGREKEDKVSESLVEELYFA
jgi:hypothetical protein